MLQYIFYLALMLIETSKNLFTNNVNFSLFACGIGSILNIYYIHSSFHISYIDQLLYLSCILYYNIFKCNIYCLWLYIRNLCCKCKIVNQESDPIIIKYANYFIDLIYNLQKFNINNYMLYDFGCGDCSTLSQLRFENKTGIDNDRECIKLSEEYIHKNNIKNIELLHNDILNVDIQNKFVIYMYEPLWLLNSNEIYINLFKKLKREYKSGYIIYVSGLFTKHLDDFIFDIYNIKIIEKTTIGSILINRNIYLLSF